MANSVKEYTCETTCWQGYINYIKEHVARELTEKEYKDMMQKYISGIKVDECLESMGVGK